MASYIWYHKTKNVFEHLQEHLQVTVQFVPKN